MQKCFCLRIRFACPITSAWNVVLPESHVTYFLDDLIQNSLPLLLYFSSPSSCFVFLYSTSHWLIFAIFSFIQMQVPLERGLVSFTAMSPSLEWCLAHKRNSTNINSRNECTCYTAQSPHQSQIRTPAILSSFIYHQLTVQSSTQAFKDGRERFVNARALHSLLQSFPVQFGGTQKELSDYYTEVTRSAMSQESIHCKISSSHCLCLEANVLWLI